MKQCIECNTNDNIIEYVTYNDDGEKKIINVCSKCLGYFNYYNDVHTTNCDRCGSLLEVDPYHYFKDNTTIYYCYNCEVWTY